MRASALFAENGNLSSCRGLGAIEANLSQGWKLKKAYFCNMSTTPDEKKESETVEKKEAVEVEGELSWSGVKIPDHFHLSWFASVMGWGQCGNQPVRQAGLEVFFSILAASTQRESARRPRTRRRRLTHPNV